MSPASEIPVVIFRGRLVLRNPTNQQVAGALGLNEAVDQTHVRDLIIVSAVYFGTRRGRLRRLGGARRTGPGSEFAGSPSGFKFKD